MAADLNGSSSWATVLGLTTALVTLVAALGGLVGVIYGMGPAGGGDSAQPTASVAAKATATPPVATATAAPNPAATATASPSPTPADEVWREGTLEIPVSGEGTGEVADLDAGKLLRAGASEATGDADLAVAETDGDIVIEPGIRQTDEGAFRARFVLVGDTKADRDGCATAPIESDGSDQSIPFSDIDIGTHVCVVTTEGRLAEIEIVDARLTGRQRWIEVRFTTWASR